MRLAVAQLDTSALVPGDAARRLLDAARMASGGGARLLVCPYAALSYPIALDGPDQLDYALELTQAIATLAQEAPLPLLVCGGVDVNGFSGNVAFFIHDGAVDPVAVGAGAKEMIGAAPGFDVDDVRFVVACTYDDLDKYADEGVDTDVVVFASAHGFAATDALSAMGVGYSEGYLSDIARDLDAWLVGAASLGGYGEDVYCGASFVVAPWGELAARAPAFEEQLFVYDIDPDTEGPLETPPEPVFFDRPLMMWLALGLGLSDVLKAQNTEDVALTLDGSLASTLCCVLASDALGPMHVHALMPCTLDENRAARAREVAATLGVHVHAPDAKLARLAKDEVTLGVIAQIELARLSDALGALPLVPYDKTGLALEADGLLMRAGWLAPLGDVYRLDLVELARLRNTISPVVPRETMREVAVPVLENLGDVAASARGQLEFIDTVLMGRVEGMRSPSELVHAYGHAPAVTAIVRCLADMAPARRGVWVLRASTRTLSDMVQPLGLVWRNRAHETSVESRIDALMSQIGSGSVPVSDEAQVRDMVNMLNELVGSGPAPTPRINPLMWGMPFSEN